MTDTKSGWMSADNQQLDYVIHGYEYGNIKPVTVGSFKDGGFNVAYVATFTPPSQENPDPDFGNFDDIEDAKTAIEHKTFKFAQSVFSTCEGLRGHHPAKLDL